MQQSRVRSSPRATSATPGANLRVESMPGHWFLARMGKRVLRPGGRRLTKAMLADLAIGSDDDVVELAAGLGATTRVALRSRPASYSVVERDENAVLRLRGMLQETPGGVIESDILKTGLPEGHASVVFGEAFLTMQPDTSKQSMIDEARRLLRPGGRYGFHELALQPDDLSDEQQDQVRRDLQQAIRVGARPLTVGDWTRMLEHADFEVSATHTAPMHLLGPRRLVDDEGMVRTLRIFGNIMRTKGAIQRMKSMHSVFKEHAEHLVALAIVARRPEG